jgi:mRNA interferase RelE/StbE
MAYRLELSLAAARQLKKIDSSLLPHVVAKIDALVEQPRPRGCEKLSGYEGMYRVRVGDHRIIYVVEDRLVLVVVLKVASRAEVYQRIRDSDLKFIRSMLKG